MISTNSWITFSLMSALAKLPSISRLIGTLTNTDQVKDCKPGSDEGHAPPDDAEYPHRAKRCVCHSVHGGLPDQRTREKAHSDQASQVRGFAGADVNPSTHHNFAYGYARRASDHSGCREAVVLLCTFPEFIKRRIGHSWVSVNRLE